MCTVYMCGVHRHRDRQMAEQKDRFLIEARKLKWETWRHQVAGQHLHTNPDALFLFFAQVQTARQAGGQAGSCKDSG